MARRTKRADRPGIPRGEPGGLSLALALLITVALFGLGACSDPAAEAIHSDLTAIQESLDASDDSGALRGARRALTSHPDSPELQLAAALACIGLKRYGEAADYAEAGLADKPKDAAVVADLQWALGSTHLALYVQLGEDDDWRLANSTLERATSLSGNFRANAAYALVRMQGLGGMGSEVRRDKFGRLFLELEPDGEKADKVRALMAAEGPR